MNEDIFRIFVSGRDLKDELKITTAYTTWIQRTVAQKLFREGIEYIETTTPREGKRAGNRKIDHLLSLSAVKEICSTSNSKNAKEILLYLQNLKNDLS